MVLGIVTISFNQAQFLQEAIDSVSLSDGFPLRYVIVDPGSTDGSRAIIERNSPKFSKIILDPDSGPGDGLNKGFASCDADILGYLNADDRYLPGALEKVMRRFERDPQVDILCGGVRLIDSHGKAQRRARLPRDISLAGLARGSCLALQQATFFKRSAFEKTCGFNPENRTSWDHEILFEMLSHGAAAKTMPLLCGDFRLHPGGITGSGRADPRYREDLKRVSEALMRLGYSSEARPSRRILSLLHRFNPKSRLLEIVLPSLLRDST